MPTPQRSQVHVNRPLTNISIAYQQAADAFVAARVFPIIPVSKQSDAFFIYNRSDMNRDEIRQRAPGTESAGGGYGLTTDTYFAKVYAFHKDIDDQTRANYDEPLNADREATQYVTNKYLIGRESMFAAAFLTTGVWGKDLTGVASAESAGTSFRQWNDQANSNPIDDVQYMKTLTLENTGFEPNVLTIGKGVWDALRNHPDILDRVRYGGNNANPAMVSRQVIAALFEVDEILVMKSVKTTATGAEPGPSNDTASISAFIGGKTALLTYRPPAPGLMTPSAGYTFAWDGYAGQNAFGSAISSFRMENIKSDRVEIEAAFAQKVTGKDLGAFFASAIA